MDIFALLAAPQMAQHAQKPGQSETAFYAAAIDQNFMDYVFDTQSKDLADDVYILQQDTEHTSPYEEFFADDDMEQIQTELQGYYKSHDDYNQRQKREALSDKVDELSQSDSGLSDDDRAKLKEIQKILNNEKLSDSEALAQASGGLLTLLNHRDLMKELANALESGDDKALELAITNLDKILERLKLDDFVKDNINAADIGFIEQQAFKELMDHFLQGLPESERPRIVDIPKGLMQKIGKELNFKPGEDTSIQGLIATDFTPEKFNEFLKRLQKGQNTDSPIVIGLVKIKPDHEQLGTEAVFLPQAVLLPQDKQAGLHKKIAAQSGSPSMDELAAKLNQLVTGGANPSGTQGTKTLDTIDIAPESYKDRKDGGFERPFRQLFESGEKTGKVQTPLTQTQAANSNGQNGTPQNAAITQSNVTSPALLTPPLGQASMALQTAGLNVMSADVLAMALPTALGSMQSPLMVSSPAQLANLTTQTGHASQGHPASQSVAATITKSAFGGENKNITIRLDPPDLGKLEIKMEFSSENKTMRAHMVVEKPETLMMLQRDSHLLQKAMEETGLDASGSELSFELSQDNPAFQQDNNGQGAGNKEYGENAKGSSDIDGDSETVIETSLNLHIDPATGLTRYDILV